MALRDEFETMKQKAADGLRGLGDSLRSAFKPSAPSTAVVPYDPVVGQRPGVPGAAPAVAAETAATAPAKPAGILTRIGQGAGAIQAGIGAGQLARDGLTGEGVDNAFQGAASVLSPVAGVVGNALTAARDFGLRKAIGASVGEYNDQIFTPQLRAAVETGAFKRPAAEASPASIMEKTTSVVPSTIDLDALRRDPRAVFTHSPDGTGAFDPRPRIDAAGALDRGNDVPLLPGQGAFRRTGGAAQGIDTGAPAQPRMVSAAEFDRMNGAVGGPSQRGLGGPTPGRLDRRGRENAQLEIARGTLGATVENNRAQREIDRQKANDEGVYKRGQIEVAKGQLERQTEADANLARYQQGQLSLEALKAKLAQDKDGRAFIASRQDANRKYFNDAFKRDATSVGLTGRETVDYGKLNDFTRKATNTLDAMGIPDIGLASQKDVDNVSKLTTAWEKARTADQSFGKKLSGLLFGGKTIGDTNDLTQILPDLSRPDAFSKDGSTYMSRAGVPIKVSDLTGAQAAIFGRDNPGDLDLGAMIASMRKRWGANLGK